MDKAAQHVRCRSEGTLRRGNLPPATAAAVPAMPSKLKPTYSTLLLIIGLVIVASNLRAPFTAVAPVLTYIERDFGLSATELGLFSSIPLLAFALLSPFVAGFARRYGLERTVFAGVLVLTAGSLIRVSGTLSMAVLGTAFVGVGIAIGNVLIPSLLKRDFPTRIGFFTAVYGLSMAIMSAIGSAIAVPLAERSDYTWRASLFVFVLLGIISAVVWAPQLLRARPAPMPVTTKKGPRLWQYPLAWQVTFFLGLNSFLYYITIAWVPAILVDSGYSEEAAGNIHGLMQLSSGTSGLAMMPFLARLTDQRWLALGAGAGLSVSLVGLQFMPQYGATWALILGFFGGAVFLLGLAFTGMRARTVEESASLSGMAQSVGYLLATTGPLIAGGIHDLTGGWSEVLWMCTALSLVIAGFGWFAGRNRQIGDGQATI